MVYGPVPKIQEVEFNLVVNKGAGGEELCHSRALLSCLISSSCQSLNTCTIPHASHSSVLGSAATKCAGHSFDLLKSSGSPWGLGCQSEYRKYTTCQKLFALVTHKKD